MQQSIPERLSPEHPYRMARLGRFITLQWLDKNGRAAQQITLPVEQWRSAAKEVLRRAEG